MKTHSDWMIKSDTIQIHLVHCAQWKIETCITAVARIFHHRWLGRVLRARLQLHKNVDLRSSLHEYPINKHAAIGQHVAA